MSYKDETMKYRDYNQFSKKVPKDAEAANIHVNITFTKYAESNLLIDK